MSIKKLSTLLLCLAFGTSLIGCQSGGSGVSLTPAQGERVKQIQIAEEQTQNLSGPMLLFYQMYHRYPKDFAQLKRFYEKNASLFPELNGADSNTPPPRTNQILVYPEGLEIPKSKIRVYLINQTPIASGHFYCLSGDEKGHFTVGLFTQKLLESLRQRME